MGLSSALPEALVKQEEEADRLYKEAYPENKPEEGKPPQEAPKEPAKAEPKPPEEPPAAKEKPPEKPPEKPAAEAKPPEKKPVEPVKAPEGFISKPDHDALQHKFDVLDGKYRAELPRALRDVDALKTELADLRTKLDKPKEEPKPESKLKKKLTPEQQQILDDFAEDFGPELIQPLTIMMEQKIEEGIKAGVEERLAGIDQKLDGVSKASAQERYDRYIAALDVKIPEWRNTVKNADFINWMAEEEGNTGRSRLQFAKEFEESCDAGRIANYYIQFGKTLTASPPPTPEPATKSGEKVNKESLVAPPTTPSASKPTSPDDEIPYVKASEMKQYSRDVINGVYKGREEEAKKLQAKFDRATAARRVIPDA